MLPIINIGPLALPAPELTLLIGFWLGLELSEKHSGRFRANPAQIYNLVLVALLAGVIGARLAYAARSPSAFFENPLNLLAPRVQMLDLTGGLMFALLGGLIYGRVRRLALWSTLDALTSLLAVLAVTLGLAHLASGDAFGAPANLPWAIDLWGERRHPSQIYEILAALLIAAAVWPGSALARPSQWKIRAAGAETPPTSPGFRFFAFLALTAAARIFLETFRGDSLVLGGFRQAQVIAWAVLALALWQLGRRLRALSQPLAGADTPGEPGATQV